MRAALKIALPALFGIVLSGCVGNSTLPSPNIGTLLQATPSDQQAAAASTDAQPAQQLASAPTTPPVPTPNPGSQPVAGQTSLAPAIKSALAPQAASPTPAEQAVTTAASQPDAAETQLSPAQPSASVASAGPAPAQSADTTVAAEANEPPKPKPANGLLALFQNNQAATARRRPVSSREDSNTVVTKRGSTGAARRPPPQLIVSHNSDRSRSGGSSLPGVDLKKLFGIETEDHEEQDEAVELASVTNMARRGTHGLLLQRPDVQVGCFPPDLLRILKQVERKFGRTPVVTSGYRSKAYNRKIRGARNSMHVYCKAADIQVQGVSKWTLAKYLRSLPGRGGVGTYCHTKSVHIDVAGKRDWNRRCRRAPKHKRKRA